MAINILSVIITIAAAIFYFKQKRIGYAVVLLILASLNALAAVISL